MDMTPRDTGLEEPSKSTISVHSDDNEQYYDAMKEIKRCKYTPEEHLVTTDDGYKITVHRVVPQTAQAAHRSVVLIKHGLNASSVEWTVLKGNLPYSMVDAGFDVWLGNSRGNPYGREHAEMDPESKTFWNFSFHEIGIYDLPCMIDYILALTGKTKLSYIGHSQGVTEVIVMACCKPEYNEKIEAVFALAPVTNLAHYNLCSRLNGLFGHLRYLRRIIGDHKVGYLNGLINKSYIKPILHNIKDYLSSKLVNRNTAYPDEEIVNNFKLLFMEKLRTGCSLKEILHHSQSISRKYSFHEFDYGSTENLNTYGTTHPPRYDLSKVTCPVMMFYGANDWVSLVDDINYLHERIPNGIGVYEMPLPNYSHMDFVYSTQGVDFILDKIHSVLKLNKTSF